MPSFTKEENGHKDSQLDYSFMNTPASKQDLSRKLKFFDVNIHSEEVMSGAPAGKEIFNAE